MATLNIGGKRVKVDDAFLQMTPEQQQATVEEIAASMGGQQSPAFAAASQASQLQGGPGPSKQQRPSFGDELLSAGRGVIEGIPVAGQWLADARRGVDASIMSMLHGGKTEQYQQDFKDRDEALRAKTGGARTAGQFGGAVAALAPLGMTAAGGRLLGMTGSLPSRIVTGGASSATISGADTLARGGSGEDALGSAGIGAAIGSALPIVGAGIRRAISPMRGNASKAQAATILQQEGVEVTAGQRTGNKGLQYREAELGGSAADDFMEQQADQFTAAALRRAGVNAPRATPDVMDAAFTNIGAQFDSLAANNDMLLDAQLGNDLANAVLRYRSVTAQAQRAPIVDDIARDLYNLRNQTVNGGPPQSLAGAAYKDLRTRIEDARRTTSDSGLAGILMEMRNALDEAAERWIQRYNPAALGEWREARRLYRNILVIENAIGRAGEKAADGIITPANLRNAALLQGKRGFVRGRSEFTDLANAGVSALTPLPNSGTPGRFSAKTLLPLGAATGGVLGAPLGPLGVLGGMAAGAALPWAVGRGMLSRPGRAYLGNQFGHQIPTLMAPAAGAVTVNKQRPIEITVRGGANL